MPAKKSGRSTSPSKKKGSKKGKRKKSRSRSLSPPKTNIDLMSKPAMENAYYTAHNAPQFLAMRGFGWQGSTGKTKKKGKKKGKKK